MNATTWPDGVIARYLTVGGTTVDLRGSGYDVSAECAGCHKNEWGSLRYSANSEERMRDYAQDHSETCRALPNPNGAQP